MLSWCSTTSKTDIESQENCSKKANEFFIQNTNEYDRVYQNYTYQNHYNKRLNKCFVLIIWGKQKDIEYHETLYDAYENKELGNLSTAMQIAGLCGLEINEKYKTCKHFGKDGYASEAIDEFNNLIKIYMND